MLEKKGNKIIITLPEVEENNTEICSLCSATPTKNSKIKKMTLDDGILSFSLYQKIGKKNICQGCKNSIKNLVKKIEKKAISEQMTFHTVKLPFIYIKPLDLNNISSHQYYFRYLKPNLSSSLEYINAYNLDIEIQEDPYLLDEYKDWDKTVIPYDIWENRMEDFYDRFKNKIFKEELDNNEYILEELEADFFVRLSKRIKN